MKRNKGMKRGRLLALLAVLLLVFGLLSGCGGQESYEADYDPQEQEEYEEIQQADGEFRPGDDEAWNVEEHTQFRKREYLEEHYEKHVIRQEEFEEFGEITVEDYLRMAQQLVDAPHDGVLTKEEDDGDLLFYDPDTNGFAVLSTDGYIRTYFRPSDGIDYFQRQ